MRNKLKELAVKKVEREEALEIIGELLEAEIREFKNNPKRAQEMAKEFARNEKLMDAQLKGAGTKADAMHLLEHAIIRTARDFVNRGMPDSAMPKIAEKIYGSLELHKGGTHLGRIPLKFI